MIYAIPLTDMSTEDLSTAIFTIQAEFRSISPNTRYKEPKIWAFDNETAIME